MQTFISKVNDTVYIVSNNLSISHKHLKIRLLLN